MRLRLFCATSVIVAFVLVGCGEPERAKPAAIRAQPFHGAGDFDEVGTVTFYPGESCASQIMFVFHGGGSTSTSIAAPFHVSKILNDAAHQHKTIRVVGKWRHGKTHDCVYVEATQAEARKSFW
jgi:hypothetical protein